jgi:hypothetical protein
LSAWGLGLGARKYGGRRRKNVQVLYQEISCIQTDSKSITTPQQRDVKRVSRMKKKYRKKVQFQKLKRAC